MNFILEILDSILYFQYLKNRWENTLKSCVKSTPTIKQEVYLQQKHYNLHSSLQIF